MKPPKRPGKPRSFSAPPQRQGNDMRQDVIPTAALSPEEAQALATWPDSDAPARRRTRKAELPRQWAEDSVHAEDPKEFDEVITKPSHLSERRREKLAERRRLHIKRAVIASVSALVVILLVWLLFFSPLLAVRQDKISVSGLQEDEALTPAQITEAMNPWVGVPVLRLNSGAVEDRLMSEYPLIKSVEVSRRLPNGVGVEVSLREPVACLMEGEACTAIDAEGVKLDLPAEQANALPHLVLAAGQDEAGAAATSMIQVLGALPEQTRERVASIEVSDAAQVTLSLSDGAVVIWGGSQDNEFKAQVLSILLQEPATRYDVSAPRAPVTS